MAQASASHPKDRVNLYQQITERIIAELEAGRVPWVQPWGTAQTAIGMPYNAVSQRRYSGVNVLSLWDATVSRGFSGHAFLTFRQAQALGGTVRRGERGVGIIYTHRFVPGEERRRAEVEALGVARRRRRGPRPSPAGDARIAQGLGPAANGVRGRATPTLVGSIVSRQSRLGLSLRREP